MNKHKISVALSGAGGYGYHYLKAFFNLPDGFNAILSSVFDPKLVDLEIYPELIKNGVNCFTEYEDFKNSLKNIDLVVIVSPIHRHGSQTIDALKHGCNVLLDKPLASSLQEAHRIIEARDASKGWVMTGYQWSFSKAIRDLKQDLLDGKLGKVKRAKTMILWPRDYNYYNRNNWAGKKYSHSGEIINDNPVNNAMAHFLHNLLYLTGSSMEESAVPVSGQAELYRAYNIQTFDTAVLELFTRDETRISFYGSHATHTEKGPLFILECDNGVVYYGELSKDIVAVFNDGSIKNYGNPDDTLQFHKLKVAIEACQNKPTLICPPEASLAHTQVIEALSEIKLIKGFEPSLVVDDGVRRYVQGLSYMIYSSYQQGVMPGQSGFAYASPGQKFNIKY